MMCPLGGEEVLSVCVCDQRSHPPAGRWWTLSSPDQSLPLHQHFPLVSSHPLRLC